MESGVSGGTDSGPVSDDASVERHSTEAQVLDDVKQYYADNPNELPFEPPDEAFLEEQFFDFSYLDDVEERERYWVNEPFAYVSIVYDDERKEHRYHIVEPKLDDFEQYVRQDLVTILRDHLIYQDIDREDAGEREYVFVQQAKDIIRRYARTVAPGTLHKLMYYLLRDFVHSGPIEPIMNDRDIEDISCDGTDVPVFVYHREYRDLKTNIRFGKRELNSFVVTLAQRSGRSISISEPLVDASLPDGSRLQLTLGGDIATRGSSFTIRKFADIPFTPIDLVNWGTFSVEEMAYYWLAIQNNKSLIFAGGTGSGKTTSLNAVSFFIPPASKIVTIENTREIDLPHENWIPYLTREATSGAARGEVTMYDLLQSALRTRPEYLLVGEIRTQERVALTFFQAMSTGHTSYTTLHADSVETVLSRLQNPPLNVPAQMIQELDIVSVQRQTFLEDRRVRRNHAIWELSEHEDNPNRIATNHMFQWDPNTDNHEKVGESHVLDEIAFERGWDEDELEAELENREQVLRYMLDNEILDYEAVSIVILTFNRDPEFVLDQIESGELELSQLESQIDEETLEAIKTHDEMTGESPPRDTDASDWMAGEESGTEAESEAGASDEAASQDVPGDSSSDTGGPNETAGAPPEEGAHEDPEGRT
jgi:flagellar protein FlaI